MLAVLLIAAQMPFVAVQAPTAVMAQSEQPSCGTEPVALNAYFETGFDIPFKLAEEFTKQYPNVTWDIKQDQFANLITTTPRLLSGDNPPDLIRLPTMVSFAKEGLLMNLDDYATAFGWDEWPVPQLNQNRVARRRHPRLRLALCHGSQLQPDRRLLQQGAGRADRHDRAAQDGRRVRRPARQGQGRRAPADHGVGQRQERHGARLPAPEPDGRLSARSSRSTTGSSRSPARRSIRRRTSIAAQHLEQWIKNGYFPPDINAIEYTDAAARFGKGEGVFTFNGDWQNAGYDTDMPGNVGFFLMPPAEAGGSPAAMSAPLTFGIAANAKNADCAAFFLNWVATNDDGPPDRRRPSVARTPAGRRMLTMPAVAEGSVTNETLAAGPVVGEAGDVDGLHRQRDELDLRPGLDA